MADRHPRLRADLVIQPQTFAGESSYVVKDPDSDHFYRFKEAEHFIASQLDGRTSPDEIRARAQERFGAPLETETLEAFLGSLGRHRLLESDRPRDPEEQRRGRLRGGMFMLRFKAFDPERLIEAIHRCIGFAFTPLFVRLSILLVLIAVVITASEWGTLHAEIADRLSLRTLLLAWGVLLVVGFGHELAHGVTCRHFGGRVKEMGFMLLYLHPALYCNVSDAWLHPSKSQRMWVSFAGAWFELILWALAVLAWRVTEPDTGLHAVALLLLATSGLKMLFNLNPLLKLDGYYLLSDWLEIPNLRKKSFRYVGAAFRRMVGAVESDPAPVTERERRVFATYGVVAAVCTCLSLLLISGRLGGHLIQRFQGAGFLMFLVMFAFIFRRRLRRFFPKSGPPPKGAPVAVKARPPARDPRLWALAALAIVVAVGRTELKVSSDVTVLPTSHAGVRPPVDGIIEEVLVHEGQWVDVGEPIMRLSDRDREEQFRELEIQIAEREARVREASGIHRGQLLRAQAAVRKAQEQVRFARLALGRLEPLAREQLVSRAEVEGAAQQVIMRERELEEARAELNVVLANDVAQRAPLPAPVPAAEGAPESTGPPPVRPANAAQAELARLDAQREHLGRELELGMVVSPIAGMVTTPERELRERVGQQVSRGELVAEVQDVRKVTAEMPISEKEISEVRVGQPVLLRTRAYPQKVFTGQVTSIAARVEGGAGLPARSGAAIAPVSTASPRTIRVTTELDNSALLLKSEMTGKAKILCGKRSMLDLATRGIGRTLKVEVWSWW